MLLSILLILTSTIIPLSYPEDFLINPPPPPFITPGELIIIISSIIAVTVASLISYRTYNNYRKKKVERAQKIYNQCFDSLNLLYLMVIDKNSGLNVYTQNFSEKEINAEMISEILRIIHNLVRELNIENTPNIIKWDYKDLILLICDFVSLRIILLMRESPSRYFLYSLEELAYDIYKNYGDVIDNFNADIKPFKGIENLLRRHLNISFLYPLNLAEIEKLVKIKIPKHDKEIIDKTLNAMKKSEKLTKLTQEEKDRIREFFRKFRDDNDYHFPYPYIFNPPSPPKEAGAEAQLKPEYIPKKQKPEITYCKYCGADLPRGALICHVCGQKI